jgi:hypothetical protein
MTLGCWKQTLGSDDLTRPTLHANNAFQEKQHEGTNPVDCDPLTLFLTSIHDALQSIQQLVPRF